MEDGPRDRWIGWNDEQRNAICKSLSVTAAFLYFPGFRLKTLPVRFLPWQSKQCPMIGKVVTVIVRFLWKRWWLKDDSRALVTKQPTGCTWGQPPAEGGWIGKISARGWLSKRFMFIRCLSDFDKSCWLAEGDGLWIQPVLLITLKLSKRSCFGQMIHDEVDKWVDELVVDVF